MRTPVITIIGVLLLPALMGAEGDCGNPIIENNGFDLWCGERLCFWEVEQGDVVKVPTWHKSDFGVEFRGTAAAISQVSAVRSNVACLRFKALGNIDETAVVTLELDFFDDGIVDYEERIPSSEWGPITFLITPPTTYNGVRFRLRKIGNGTAALAEMVVEPADKCVDPPLEIEQRPFGAHCNDSSECAGDSCVGGGTGPAGITFPGRCSACTFSDDCPSGQACGLEIPASPVLSLYSECGEARRHGLGERCQTNFECSTGVCDNGLCSTCRANADCPGSSCVGLVVDDPGDGFLVVGPTYCEGAGSAGSACIAADGCASGDCSSSAELAVCAEDGRLCDDDDDCAGRDHCVVLGPADGICQ